VTHFALLTTELGKALKPAVQDRDASRDGEARNDEVLEIADQRPESNLWQSDSSEDTRFQSRSPKWADGENPRAVSTKRSASNDGRWMASSTKTNLPTSRAGHRYGRVVQKFRSPTSGSSAPQRRVAQPSRQIQPASIGDESSRLASDPRWQRRQHDPGSRRCGPQPPDVFLEGVQH
jgi:hypothetical protein